MTCLHLQTVTLAESVASLLCTRGGKKFLVFTLTLGAKTLAAPVALISMLRALRRWSSVKLSKSSRLAVEPAANEQDIEAVGLHSAKPSLFLLIVIFFYLVFMFCFLSLVRIGGG